MNLGRRRELSVSDLALELADIKRNAERFGQGIFEFEPRESDQSHQFVADFDKLANLGVRTAEQQPKFNEMVEVNARRIKTLEKNELELLEHSEHRTPQEELRYLELKKPDVVAKERDELARLDGLGVRNQGQQRRLDHLREKYNPGGGTGP